MRRRDFLKKSTVAAGLAGSLTLLRPVKASENSPEKPDPTSSPTSQSTAAAREENRSTEYLRQAQQDDFLPKQPVVAKSSRPDAIQISPMPLAERVRRKIVPQRGFCSFTPDSGTLLSGNGPMNIELLCNPYTEQIPFRHESLFAPRQRPFEAPNIAGIFPQVRQMVLDGKYHEAAQFAYQKWQESNTQGGRMGFGGGGGFSMTLEFPGTASVKDYLRTVDFESTEVKVHWTDERGDWIRRTFTSRPDNAVIQWLTAPQNQSVNVRITVSAERGGTRGARGGRAGSGAGGWSGGDADLGPGGSRSGSEPGSPPGTGGRSNPRHGAVAVVSVGPYTPRSTRTARPRSIS